MIIRWQKKLSELLRFCIQSKNLTKEGWLVMLHFLFLVRLVAYVSNGESS